MASLLSSITLREGNWNGYKYVSMRSAKKCDSSILHINKTGNITSAYLTYFHIIAVSDNVTHSSCEMYSLCIINSGNNAFFD